MTQVGADWLALGLEQLYICIYGICYSVLRTSHLGFSTVSVAKCGGSSSGIRTKRYVNDAQSGKQESISFKALAKPNPILNKVLSCVLRNFTPQG